MSIEYFAIQMPRPSMASAPGCYHGGQSPSHNTGQALVAALLGLRHIAPQRRAQRRLPRKRCAKGRAPR